MPPYAPPSYGERPFLAYVLEWLWCSWHEHRLRTDCCGNLRCVVCLRAEVDDATS